MRATLSFLTRAACVAALLAAPAAVHAQFGKLVKRAASLGGGAVAQAASAAGQVAGGMGADGLGAGNVRGVRVPLPGEGGGAGGAADPRRERYEACMAQALENPGPAAAVTNEAFAREYGALGQRMAALGQRVMTTPPDSPRYAALQDSATMLGEAMARLQYPNVAARCGPEVWPSQQGTAAGAPGAVAALATAPVAGSVAATARGAGAPGAGGAVKSLGRVGAQVALATATGGTAPLLVNAGLSAGRSVLAARRTAQAAKAARASAGTATNAAATAAPTAVAPR